MTRWIVWSSRIVLLILIVKDWCENFQSVRAPLKKSLVNHWLRSNIVDVESNWKMNSVKRPIERKRRICSSIELLDERIREQRTVEQTSSWTCGRERLFVDLLVWNGVDPMFNRLCVFVKEGEYSALFDICFCKEKDSSFYSSSFQKENLEWKKKTTLFQIGRNLLIVCFVEDRMFWSMCFDKHWQSSPRREFGETQTEPRS